VGGMTVRQAKYWAAVDGRLINASVAWRSTARPDDDRVSSTWAADAAAVMIDDSRDADETAEHRPVAKATLSE